MRVVSAILDASPMEGEVSMLMPLPLSILLMVSCSSCARRDEGGVGHADDDEDDRDNCEGRSFGGKKRKMKQRNTKGGR